MDCGVCGNYKSGKSGIENTVGKERGKKEKGLTIEDRDIERYGLEN